MKLVTAFLSFLIILSTLRSSNSQPVTDSIRLGPNTGYDCMLSSINANTNYSDSYDIIAFAWTFGFEFGLGRSVFKYNLEHISPQAKILNAKLSLYGNYFSGSSLHSGMNKSYIRKVTTDWNAFTATWKTQPDYSTVNQATLEQSTSPHQDYRDIDVTDLVKEMVRDPSHNYGFMLILRTEAIYRCMNFSSGDCPDLNKRPLLVITYNNVIGITNSTNSVPDEFNVYQNYPNPFNPVTKIKFEIPKASFTVLTIYNELGMEIENPVNEKLNAGSYEVEWNGSNKASGIYFYRIQSGDFTETRRMTLVK